MEKRPNLEVLSWIAGIVGLPIAAAALFFTYDTYSKSSSESASTPQTLASVNPSFDCPKASNKVERLICSSNDIALLDLSMANAYRDLQSEIKTVEKITELKLAQNNWLKNIRNTCENVQCLKEVYFKRTKTLQSLRR